MSALLAAIVLVGWFSLFIWFMWMAADANVAWPWVVALAVWAVISVAVVLQVSAEEDAKGPCLREETSYQWNPATKTVMPYTFCADRGTWSK